MKTDTNVAVIVKMRKLEVVYLRNSEKMDTHTNMTVQRIDKSFIKCLTELGSIVIQVRMFHR